MADMQAALYRYGTVGTKLLKKSTRRKKLFVLKPLVGPVDEEVDREDEEDKYLPGGGIQMKQPTDWGYVNKKLASDTMLC